MLMERDRSLLVISNMQELMMPILDVDERFISNNCWLMGLANKLGVPILVMEHKRLGPLTPPIAALANGRESCEIITFSFANDPVSLNRIRSTGRDQLVLAGNETHISVLHTALDAKRQGFEAYVVAEACASRCRDDHHEAVRRMRQGGVTIVTREMLLFEWIRYSEDPLYLETSIAFVKHPHTFPRGEQ